MSHMLVVCTGNICRSPLAEVLFIRELAAAGRTDITVASAGTGAWDGAPASEGAYLVALEHSLDLSGHRARLLTRALMDEATIVFTMASHHAVRAAELGGEDKTWLLGEYAGRTGPGAEVSDPFGSDIEVYRATYAELDELVRAAVARFLDEENHATGA